jgi:predicted HTH domain antitoxin
MQITIPDEIIKAMDINPDDVLKEIAISFYQNGKLSIIEGAKLAKMEKINFQFLLASRGINILFCVEEFKDKDLENEIDSN